MLRRLVGGLSKMASQQQQNSTRKIAISAMKLSPEAEAAAYRIREMEVMLENNPYFLKYQPKFEQLKKNDPVEYLRRLDKLHQATVAQAEAMKQRALDAEKAKEEKAGDKLEEED